MNRKALLWALLAVGCAPTATPPSGPSASRPMAIEPSTAAPVPTVREATPVAFVEPYLVPASLPATLSNPIPPTLGGRIEPHFPVVPVIPSAPLRPLPPATAPAFNTPAPNAPAPTAPSHPTVPAAPPVRKPSRATIPDSVVRLFQEERGRSVDAARQRLQSATDRATRSAADAQRLWGYVKEGFVAQKQAETADAAAKSAAADQADAQKALDAAMQRQRDARHDLEAAYGLAEMPDPFEPIALTKPAPAFQAVPFAFRLSIVGGHDHKVVVTNGTLGRALDLSKGESAAYLVRCADPSRLKVTVDGQPANVVVRSLPTPTPAAAGV